REREPIPALHRDRRQQRVLLPRCVEQLELRRSLPDLRDRAVAADGAYELVHRGTLVVARAQTREMANVDDRGIGVKRPALRLSLELDPGAQELPAASVTGGAERGAGSDLRRRRRRDLERPRHPHLAALLREALDPAARHREVLVDPDERA